MAAAPSQDRLCDRVRDIVTRIAGPHRTPANAGPATPLAEGGFWLDSIALLEVIVACETEFGVTFDSARDLTRDTLKSVESLAAVIRGRF